MNTYVAEIGEIVRAQRRDEEYVDEISEKFSKVFKELLGQRRWIRWYPYLKTIASSLYYSSTVVVGNQTLGEEYVHLFESDGLQRVVPSIPSRVSFVLLHSVFPLISNFLIQKAEATLTHPSTNRFLGIDIRSNRKARQSFLDVFHWLRTVLFPQLQRAHCALFYITGSYYSIARRATRIRFLSASAQSDIPALKVYRFLGFVTLAQLAISALLAIFSWLETEKSQKNLEKSKDQKLGKGLESSDLDAISLSHPTFQCTICLENRNPSALFCGHLFCWQCIQEHATTYSGSTSSARCPSCRLEFQPRDSSLCQYSSPNHHPTIYFTGIQPTGIPHLGNFFGSIEPWIDLQNSVNPEDQMMLSVVDQHAISLGPLPADQLRRNTRQMTASVIACGVDPSRTLLFRQSDIPQIAQLSWILGSLQTTSKLARLPQYKEKQERFKKGDIPVGLLTYPLLQAADVLTFKATTVPVGEDQSQHLNLLGGLAYAFNKTYQTDIFPIPKQLTREKNARIRSLREPEKKMSKSSGGPRSRIEITDSRETIIEKCQKAQSDTAGAVTYDKKNRLAVSNLLDLYSAITKTPLSEIDYSSWSTLDLKMNLAEKIDNRLEPIREKFEELENSEEIDKILERNGDAAREIAEKNLKEIRRIVGFL
ncbi:Protein CBR-WARS-2 [Caenorhabditis briggsae]|uniref:tryptophan--tRNA ligase n=1 Tax=Caenorhabditis briggsae TaxID=6238 RepID=A8XZC2_CAEBR|nr:Protein CBR-WARS-2 [Caenorhabditis briggsae]CAP38049.1 Protein CBR-WARS-2 [Caenorhabditis briggsae]